MNPTCHIKTKNKVKNIGSKRKQMGQNVMKLDQASSISTIVVAELISMIRIKGS
jgi:hypothetical protein